MKTIQQSLGLTLACLLLAGCIGCASDNPGNTTNTTVPEGGTTAEVTTAEPEISYEPPAEDFGNTDGSPRTFTMLVRKARYGYLWDDGSSPDRVNAAAYKRNAKIEDRYHIKIEIEELEDKADTWKSTLLASTGEYDLACFDYWWGIERSGLLYDLKSMPELNTDAPHWYSGWNDNVTINNKLVSIVGDATLEVLQNLEVVFFNKDIAEDYNLDLYGLVNDGKWTLDKMNEINAAVAANLNDDNPNNDIYGALYDLHSVAAQMYAAGIQFSKIADDGSVSLEVNMDKTTSIVDAVTKLIHSGNVRYDSNTARSGNNQGVPYFTSKGALFYATALYLGQTIKATNTDVNYGVLVSPKYDESASYITNCYGASLLGIPLSVKEPHVSAVILDALNYYSKDTVVESFYEIVMKSQIADAQEDANMIDLARNALRIDFAFVQDLGIVNAAKQGIIHATPVASAIEAELTASKAKLDTILKAYE